MNGARGRSITPVKISDAPPCEREEMPSSRKDVVIVAPFPPVFIAEKYEVHLSFDFRRKLNDVQPSWAAYLLLLTKCEVMLKEKKVGTRLWRLRSVYH